MRERVLPFPPGVPRASGLSDEALFERLRRAPEDGAADTYRDELLARLRPRLYQFFRSLAASSRLTASEAHDLAEDLTQETLLRVASDADTAHRLLAGGADEEDTERPDARLDFSRVRQNPNVYAFSTARRVWATHVGAKARRRVRLEEAPEEPQAPSASDLLERAETEAEWEQRRRYGEQLRAAEADCVARFAATRPVRKLKPETHALLAELWLWCSLARGSAAAFYVANGVTARNTTRDLDTVETFLRPCLGGKGVAQVIVDALCGYVRRRAAGGRRPLTATHHV